MSGIFLAKLEKLRLLILCLVGLSGVYLVPPMRWPSFSQTSPRETRNEWVHIPLLQSSWAFLCQRDELSGGHGFALPLKGCCCTLLNFQVFVCLLWSAAFGGESSMFTALIYVRQDWKENQEGLLGGKTIFQNFGWWHFVSQPNCNSRF